MANETNGFKAVYRDPIKNELRSAAVHDHPALGTLYVPGVPASNPSGPLMFFETQEEAQRFIKYHAFTDIEIWSCTTTNARPCMMIILRIHHMSADWVRRWWNGAADLSTNSAFKGTLVADTITLIERVDTNG